MSRITGTGIGGRVTKQDILAFLNSGGARNQSARQPGDGSAGIAAAAPKAAPTVSAPASAAPFAAAAGSGAKPSPTKVQPVPGTAVPMTVMRKKIAEHMIVSRRTSAHVHTVFQVDFTHINELRQQKKAEYEKAGVKLD